MNRRTENDLFPAAHQIGTNQDLRGVRNPFRVVLANAENQFAILVGERAAKVPVKVVAHTVHLDCLDGREHLEVDSKAAAILEPKLLTRVKATPSATSTPT